MFIYTCVYLVQKRPSPPIPRPCQANKVDTSPALQKYHAEEIGYATPLIFHWVAALPRALSLPKTAALAPALFMR